MLVGHLKTNLNDDLIDKKQSFEVFWVNLSSISKVCTYKCY